MLTPIQALNKLQIQFVDLHDRLMGVCPVHNGDNPTAFSMFKENGCWVCFTHGCHEKYGKTLYYLVRALIAQRKNVPLLTANKEARDFLELGSVTEPVYTPLKLLNFEEEAVDNTSLLTTDNIRNRVKIAGPSPYYLRRGFSPDILTKFHVCESPMGSMSQRAIVPTLSADGKLMVGYSGRATNDANPKWLHSYGFRRNFNLYNSWNAAEVARASGLLIITEGFAKVWRLEECGIHNAIAIYGTNLGEQQIDLINGIGANRMAICMDNDEPGKAAAKRIQQRLAYFYKTFIIDTPIIDLDEASHSEINRYIKPLI